MASCDHEWVEVVQRPNMLGPTLRCIDCDSAFLKWTPPGCPDRVGDVVRTIPSLADGPMVDAGLLDPPRRVVA